MAKNPEKQAYPPIHALIVAAGSGTRTGSEKPKQYWTIHGQSILSRTIQTFTNLDIFNTINIVMNPDHQALYDDAVKDFTNIYTVKGGNTRKDSVYNALSNLSHLKKNDIILIHDAARPLIAPKDIEKVINAAIASDAATLCGKVTDTIFNKNEVLGRESLRSIQTPQAFKYSLIKSAHESFKGKQNFTDDAGLVIANGSAVEFITASAPNIKITTAHDFDIIGMMIEQETSIRAASGFDVHAFADTLERPLILGGIEIKHDRSLIGHSDADVILHTITDAILGTINAGDIGSHFPPSEEKWKDKDSSFFLSEAVKKLAEHQGILEFIDITVICEKPKIGKYRKSIQTRIAEILDVSKDIVSIKATTTEGLGFTGRKEGIACQAIATVKIKK